MTPTEFLAFLHQNTEHDVELRCFHNTDRKVKSRSIWTRARDDIDGFVDRYNRPDYGTFFGVATRKNRGGKIDDTLEIPALWIDCDNHRPIDELKSCFMPPSAIVETGGGVHAYWRLDEPYDVADVVYGQHQDHPVMRALAGLKRVFNGDNKVVDLARVMRLPGTTNSKRDEHVVCTVLERNDHEYSFSDIEDWLTWQRELVGEPVDPFLAAMEEMNIKPPLDVQEMLDGMVHGENVHEVQLRVSASLQAAGVPDEEIVERIITATRLAVGQQGARWDWKRESATVRDMLQTARQKFSAPKVAASAGGGTVVSIEDEKKKREPEQSSGGEDIPVFVRAGQVALRVWKKPVISIAGELWTYERGVWRRFDEDDEAELLAKIQGALSHLKASPSVANKRNAMQWIVSNPDLFRRGVKWDKKRIIVGRNGTLEIDTGTIRAHAEDDFATIGVDCDLDPDAECPVWMEFLNAALPQHSIDIMQEWFGAALIREKKREVTRALFLKGGDNTGKSQISGIAMALRGGTSRIKSAKVKTLAGDFGYEQFVGATGWIADDAVGQNEFIQPEAFKILVTGEPVSFNRKGTSFMQTRFDFPVLLTCNHLPRVRDDSNAVYSRSIVVPMIKRFDEATAPPEETQTTVIRDELAGVINWALAGWTRLMERGRYDMPEQLKFALQEFRDGNTPIIGWIRQCTTKEEYGTVDNRDIRASFIGFLAANFGEQEKQPAPRDLYQALRDQGRSVDVATVKGSPRQRGMHLNEMGLAYWLEGIKRQRGDAKGSGCKQDEVNKFYKAVTKTSPGHRQAFEKTTRKKPWKKHLLR